MVTRWPALSSYVKDGPLEIDNNAAARSLGGMAVGRKNWLFAGSDQGGHPAATIYNLINTAKLNGVDREAWLTDTIAGIADHPARSIDDLLPWKYRPAYAGALTGRLPEAAIVASAAPQGRKGASCGPAGFENPPRSLPDW